MLFSIADRQADEAGLSIPGDLDQDRVETPITHSLDSRIEIAWLRHGLVVHFKDHITGGKAALSCSAVAVNVLDQQAARTVTIGHQGHAQSRSGLGKGLGWCRLFGRFGCRLIKLLELNRDGGLGAVAPDGSARTEA